MKLIIILALLGASVADKSFGPRNGYQAPGNRRANGGSNGRANGFNGGSVSNSYSAPSNGRSNGFGNGNAVGNSYSAPANGGLNGFNGGSVGNSYSAPRNGGFNGGNGQTNGVNGGNAYSAPSNGRINGGNGGNGYSAPANGGSNGLSSAYGAPSAEEELAELAASLPGGGVPGEDFPVLSEVPDTGFQCGDQAFSGYYADDAEEARCQVFHICQLRESGKVQQDSFLCPNGTIFNQQYLVCDWWFNFDCSQAQGFYSVNEQIGKIETNGAYGAQSFSNSYAAPRNGNGQNGNGYANGISQIGNGFSNGARPNGNGYSNGNNRNGGNGGNGRSSKGNGYSG